MKTKNIYIIRVIGFCCALLIMGLIFYMSAQNNESSGTASAGIIDFVAKILNPDYNEMTVIQQEEYIESFQFIVRKGAHFSLYAMLAFFLSMGMLTFGGIKIFFRFIISFGVNVLYSISDEIHQLFVPGRSGEVRDVLIDSLGGICGCLLIYICYIVYKKRKSSR